MPDARALRRPHAAHWGTDAPSGLTRRYARAVMHAPRQEGCLMNTEPALSPLDALADAIALRLARGMPMPDGPFPELPQFPDWPPGRIEPDLARRTRLAISGIELVQVTQHFQSANGADNSVPLVALKPLVVRAYPAVRLPLGQGRGTGKPGPGRLGLLRQERVHRDRFHRAAAVPDDTAALRLGTRVGRPSDDKPVLASRS